MNTLRSPFLPALTLVSAFGLSLTAGAQRKLNGPLAIDFAPFTNVGAFALADGEIIYQAGSREIDAVPQDGSAPVVPIFHSSQSNVFLYETQLTSDGTRVVFRSDLETDEVIELFSLATDGSGTPLKLHPSLPTNQDVTSFRIAPDGQRAVYFANGTLFSVPVDGSEPPAVLSAALNVTDAYQITADSRRVIFMDIFQRELFTAPIAGGAAPVTVHPALIGAREVTDWMLAPDGSRVVYRLDFGSNGVYELYSSPADGSGPQVKLNGPFVAGGDVFYGYSNAEAFQISPDSALVTYVADQTADEVWALYCVPITGGTAVELTAGAAGRTIYNQALSPDGTRVVYLADHHTAGDFDFYSAPSDDSSAPVNLTSGLSGGEGNVDFVIDPSSDRVVFRWTMPNSITELYSAPLDGSALPVRLNSALPANCSVAMGFQFASGGTSVVFRANPGGSGAFELFSAPLDGSSAATRLHPPLVQGGSVSAFVLDAAGTQALYRAEQDFEDLVELFVVPVDGSQPPVPRSDIRDRLITVGDVWSFVPTPDGSTAYYYANEAAGSGWYAVNLEGSPQRVWVAAGGTITPDFQHAVSTSAGLLYSVPLDGSAGPIQIGSGWIEMISPDSSRVVNRRQTDSYSPLNRIMSAPVAGGSPQVELNLPRAWDGEVLALQFTPDSSRLVYVGNQDIPGVLELFSVPLDGSAAPVKLNDTLVAGGDVGAQPDTEEPPLISADGSRVVYLADRDVNNVIELYSVPVEGGTPPTELSVIPGTHRDVKSFAISPDSTRVVYVADQDADEVFELYSVPLAGGAPPIELSAISGPDQDVDSAGFYWYGYVHTPFLISPDSCWVVYRADQDQDGVFDLYRSPLAGDSPPVRLTSGAASNQIALISPDSAQVVYVRLDPDWNQLFTVAMAGGSAPVCLSGDQPVSWRNQGPLATIDDGGDWLLFRATPEPGVTQLFAAPIHGLRPPVEIGGPLDHGAFRPGTSEVLYVAGQDEPGVLELYLSDQHLKKKHLRTRSR